MEVTDNVKRLREVRLMTAIKTPYAADGNIDFIAFDKHIDHQIANGVQALIIGGTTGEGHLLSWEEHLMLISRTKGKYGDKIIVVGNTGSNSTAESAYATKKGFASGMDCSLLINPYYGKTSGKGITMHLEKGLEYGPGIIYNVPGRTSQDIKPEVMLEVAKHPNFVGVKECMGHDRIKELSGKGVVCWSGNDEQCYESRVKHGATGVISVTSNIVPGLMRKLMFEEDDALDAKLQPLYKWLFTDPNPIGVNTMLMQLGASKPVFRLPYTFVSKQMREEGKQLLTSIGLEHCPLSDSNGMSVLEDSDFQHILNGD